MPDIIDIVAINSSMSTTIEDIEDAGSQYSWISSAQTVNIASSSTSDTNTAGIGARKIAIHGLGSSYEDLSEVVNLNGTTNVLSANTYQRINSMEVLDAGSLQDNAGDITAKTSGTVETISTMKAGLSRTHSSAYSVTNGKILTLNSIEVSCSFSGEAGFLAKLLHRDEDGFFTAIRAAVIHSHAPQPSELITSGQLILQGNSDMVVRLEGAVSTGSVSLARIHGTLSDLV